MTDYRSYNEFNKAAIKTLTKNSDNSNYGWNDGYITDEYSTPINADNLNAMLNMLIYIRNVIGKTTDFAKTINGTTINLPDTTSEDTNKSVATYIKEVADAIIGTSTDDKDADTIIGVKRYTDAKIDSLSFDDIAVDNKFVTAVSQADGKISVTRKLLDAGDIPSITHDKISDFETSVKNIEVRNASNAINATNDSNGNSISGTYATKAELNAINFEIKTYNSFDAAKSDLSNLTQGQIITVVNENTADAYIVGYECNELVKISGGNSDIISPVSTTDIDLILSGNYEGEPISDSQKSMIDSILLGTFDEEASDEQKNIIDDILANNFMEV